MAEQTKNQLRAALLQQLTEKPFDKIRIKDIVESCGYNRNTFYYYYNDIYALLEDVLLTQARGFIKRVHDGAPWTSESIRVSEQIKSSKTCAHLYKFVEQSYLQTFVFRVCDELVGALIEKETEGMNVDETDVKLIRVFYRCASAGIILNWLNAGLKWDARDVVERVERLMGDGITLALEKAKKK